MEEISWLMVCGPLSFGAGLGYLMANLFVTEEHSRYQGHLKKLKPTWQGITTFIAVTFSIAILKVFPQLSNAFWSYALGVGIGIFIEEIIRIMVFNNFET